MKENQFQDGRTKTLQPRPPLKTRQSPHPPAKEHLCGREEAGPAAVAKGHGPRGQARGAKTPATTAGREDVSREQHQGLICKCVRGTVRRTLSAQPYHPTAAHHASPRREQTTKNHQRGESRGPKTKGFQRKPPLTSLGITDKILHP